MKKVVFLITCWLLLIFANCKKDPCEHAVCLNGGNCIEGVCECPSGYAGEHCETLLDPCENVMCLNDGYCEDGICICPLNYSGQHCEIYNDPCGEINCFNGGICIDGICDCPPGFTGTYCQTPQNVYAKSVTIFTIPATDWDSFSSPDLKVYLSRSASSSWDYSTPELSDHSSTPVTLTFYSPVLMTDEDWDIKIVDVDSPDPDDNIYTSYGFSPYPIPTDMSLGFINNSSGQLVFQINLQ